jgi:hypothetical protein
MYRGVFPSLKISCTVISSRVVGTDMIVVLEQDDDAVLVWMVRTIEVSEWEHVVKTVFYINYELESVVVVQGIVET